MTEAIPSPEVMAQLQDLAFRAELSSIALIESHAVVHQFFDGLINVTNDIGGGTVAEDGGGLAVRLNFSLRAARADTGERVYDLACSFLARYSIELGEAPRNEVLDVFTSTTGMLTLYPYAREYIQTETARMGMTAVLLPPFRIAPAPFPETLAKEKPGSRARKARSSQD